MVTLTPPTARNSTTYPQLDGDHSGELTALELREGLDQFGIRVSPEEAAAMVQSADYDGNGRIDFDEARRGGAQCTCGSCGRNFSDAANPLALVSPPSPPPPTPLARMPPHPPPACFYPQFLAVVAKSSGDAKWQLSWIKSWRSEAKGKVPPHARFYTWLGSAAPIASS